MVNPNGILSYTFLMGITGAIKIKMPKKGQVYKRHNYNYKKTYIKGSKEQRR